MTELKHATLICPVSDTPLADALCSAIGGVSGSNMFTRKVYTGEDHTHYIATGLISGQFYDLLNVQDYSGEEMVQQTANIPAIVYLAGQGGVTTTEAEVQGLLDRSDISNQGGYVALARCNLSLTAEAA